MTLFLIPCKYVSLKCALFVSPEGAIESSKLILLSRISISHENPCHIATDLILFSKNAVTVVSRYRDPFSYISTLG